MSPPPGALSVLADPALVQLAVGGDTAAFEALDRRHRPTVLRQCTCLLRSLHDAEEATQQAMFKAYRALDKGTTPTSFLPWLLTIARNECFDLIRARKGVEPLSAEVAAGGETPPERVERRERVAMLKEDLVELPESQRRALMLRGVGDLSHAEIARILGGTPMEMRTLVHEARSSLAEFEAGRELDCAVVRERIDTGDGRALRARRVRAHLRACEPCSLAAGRVGGTRRRVASFLPFPIFGAIRAALFGGGPAGVAGPAGVVGVSAAVVAAVVIGFGGGGSGGGAFATDGAAGASARHTALVTGVSATPPANGGASRARTTTRPGATDPTATDPTATAGAGAASATPVAGVAPSQGTGGQSSTPAASGPAVATPSLPGVPATPSLSTPGVATPPVTVPPVTVGSVAVPSVTVPSVTVPPVTTPALPIVGSVATPQVTTPPVTTPPIVTPPISTPAIVIPPVTVPPVGILP